MPTKTRIIYRNRAMGKPAPKRRRRAPQLLSPTTMRIVMDGAIIGGSAVGSTVAVNLAPVIKDQAGWLKSLAQAGTGIALMTMQKNRQLKKAGMGCIVGGTISLALPLLPETMRVFGGRRAFSPGELRALQTMGRPYALGRPAAIPAPSDANMQGTYRSRARAR